MAELTLGQRLKEERERSHLTQQKLADIAGVSVQTQRNYESDRRVPDANYIKAILQDIDVQYILTGESGTLYKAPQTRKLPWASTASSPPDYGVHEAGNDYAEDFVYIPLLEIEVSAGDGATNDQPEQIMDRLAFKKTWLDKMNISNKSCRMVYAWGDSMEPGIHDGDAVLVDTSTTAEQFRDGIWVLRTEDGLIVKRLQRTPEGGIIIISDNELYPPIEVKDGGLKSLDLVGRVKAAGAWRRML